MVSDEHKGKLTNMEPLYYECDPAIEGDIDSGSIPRRR
jgi:hypothetical protein